MADEAQAPASAAAGEPLVVNLHIVSPSVGVTTPLNFNALPATTTVRELKAKIRDILPMRPIDDHQRLIHRGRLITRENDTLQDVFGVETLRTTDQQSLHLVLRDLQDAHAPGAQAAAPNRGPSPAPHLHHHHNPHHHAHHFRPGARQVPHPAFPIFPAVPVVPGAQVPAIGDPHVIAAMSHHQQIQQQQIMQQQQAMMQWMNQIQRGERNAPAPAQPGTVTREMIGPNGQYMRVTFNANTNGANPGAPSGHPTHPGMAQTFTEQSGPLTPAEAQHIVGRHDAAHAARASPVPQNAASPAWAQATAQINGIMLPVPPGVTTPLFPNLSAHNSRATTPDLGTGRILPHGSNPTLAGPTSQPQPRPRSANTPPVPQGAEFYVLSSPSGPRGILVSGSGTFVSPPPAPAASPGYYYQYARQPTRVVLPATAPQQRLTAPATPGQRPQRRRQQAQATGRRPPIPTPAEAQQHQAQGHVQVQVRAGQPVAVRQAHAAANPNNQGMAALVGAMWPHIWLAVRLGAFVWWFTSADPSLSRWIAVLTLAAVVFFINTGLLNGVAHQVWEPIRVHLEGLLPFANPDRPAEPAPEQQPAANNGDGGAAARARNLDPAETAARLVAQHRQANGNRLLDLIRRAERAGLLFLASIAPGVAERHIAHIEAQERAERRQREEAAAEALAAANAAAEAAANAAPNSEEVTEEADSTGAAAGQGDGDTHNEQAPPLIDV